METFSTPSCGISSLDLTREFAVKTGHSKAAECYFIRLGHIGSHYDLGEGLTQSRGEPKA